MTKASEQDALRAAALHWEACRYVHDDPTLDRFAFEDRMLEDAELALMVTQVVEEMELASQAIHGSTVAKQTRDLPVTASSQATVTSFLDGPSKLTWKWVVSLAAVLIVGVTLSLQFTSPSAPEGTTLDRSSSHAANDPIEPELAEHWLQLVSNQAGDDDSEFVNDSLSSAEAMSDDMLPSWSNEHVLAEDHDTTNSTTNDWLIEAAQQFYSEGAAS